MIDRGEAAWYMTNKLTRIKPMDGLNIAEAKAQFSDLIERAESGEEIEIRRRGKPVAKIVPIYPPRKPIDFEMLRELRSSMKMSEITGVEILREMRDSRY